MKKLYLFLLITVCFIFGGLSKVNAEERSLLHAFGKDTNENSITELKTGENSSRRNITIKLNETVDLNNYDYRICAFSDSDIKTNEVGESYIEVKKSDCSQTTVTFSLRESSYWYKGDATLNNGVVTGTKDGPINAVASSSGLEYVFGIDVKDPAVTTRANDANRPTNTTTTTTKTTTSTSSSSYNDSNFTSDVVTSENPSTGLSDILVYIIPISIIGGSILVFRKRMA